jgi:uncharacterized membrane protein
MREAMGTRRFQIVLVAVTVLTLAASFALKRRCAEVPWNGQQYRTLCYNDIQALYGARRLDQRLFPYVVEKSYEYPVVIGLQMWLASHLASDHGRYFLANVPALALCALLTVIALIRAVGARAKVLWFAAGVPLGLHAFLNWDLLAVAPLALAMWAWSRRRDALCGMALGLGAAAKLFPGYVLPALCLARLKRSPGGGGWRARARAAVPLAVGFLAAWGAVNVPIMVADVAVDGELDGWLGVFLFHARRLPDFGTVWYWWPSSSARAAGLPWIHWAPPATLATLALLAWFLPGARFPSRRGVALVAGAAAAIALLLSVSPAMASGPVSAGYKALVDRVSFAVFALGSVGLWVHQWLRDRDPWATGGATVALFLLVAKVHSPQYALWLLPFFVTVTLPVWLGVAYFVADAAIVYSGFHWYWLSPQLGPHPWQTVFVAMTFVRSVLLLLLIAWFTVEGRDLTRSA